MKRIILDLDYEDAIKLSERDGCRIYYIEKHDNEIYEWTQDEPEEMLYEADLIFAVFKEEVDA